MGARDGRRDRPADPREAARLADRYARPTSSEVKAAKTIQGRFKAKPRGKGAPEKARLSAERDDRDGGGRGDKERDRLRESGRRRHEDSKLGAVTSASATERPGALSIVSSTTERGGNESERSPRRDRSTDSSAVGRPERAPPASPGAVSYAATSLSATLAGSSLRGSLNLTGTAAGSSSHAASLSGAALGGSRGGAASKLDSEKTMAQRMKTMALDIEAALTTNAANARAGAAAAAAMPLAMAYSNAVRRRETEVAYRDEGLDAATYARSARAERESRTPDESPRGTGAGIVGR